MAFTGDEGDMIDPKLAQQWIDNYQKGLGPNDIRAEFVGFRKINELMSQGKAVGIRIYYGRDDAGANKLLLVAVGADEANIASIDGSKSLGMVLDNTRPCPPYCPPS